MKKLTLLGCAAAIGLAAHFGSSSTAGQSNPSLEATPANSKQPVALSQETAIAYHMAERYADTYPAQRFSGNGLPPKEWGQLLQSQGRQVWTKSGKGRSKHSKTSQPQTDACKTA